MLTVGNHLISTILITGATGSLGKVLLETLEPQYSCIPLGYQHKPLSGYKLDLTNGFEVMAFLDKFKPDVIIHCAALTDVDLCEKDAGFAYKLNVLATKNIVNWVLSKPKQTKIVYISTDQVYDSNGLSLEKDVNPVNMYAITKLWGEDIVRRHDNHLILRTNFYDMKIKGIANWIIQSIKNKKEIFVFDDIYFNPLYLPHLINLIIKLILENITGTINLGASGPGMSKAEFAERIASVFKLQNNIFTHCNSTDIGFLDAKRPKDMRMNILNAESELGFKLPDIDEGIKEMYSKR